MLTEANKHEAVDSGYFDEEYFQQGPNKGTVYTDYKNAARQSPTYREIAEALVHVFQPRRVLEIGCATGIIVKHLNDMGCEAWGIDVSKWAVDHAEHPQVRHASAAHLPFESRYFDLVFSCHAIEHLPDEVFSQSMQEMTRVCSDFQFHMLPIPGTPPYVGDIETVRSNLKKDPTHQQLQPMEWWLEEFSKVGLFPFCAPVLFVNDTPQTELSNCQFALRTLRADPEPVIKRAADRTRQIHRILFERSKPVNRRMQVFAPLVFGDEPGWNEIDERLPEGTTVDLSGCRIRLDLFLEGEPAVLRLAAGTDREGISYADVAEFYVSAEPGFTSCEFTPADMRILRGQPDYRRINHLGFGGQAKGCQIRVSVVDQNDRALVPGYWVRQPR